MDKNTETDTNGDTDTDRGTGTDMDMDKDMDTQLNGGQVQQLLPLLLLAAIYASGKLSAK